jgi:regulator of sirC expression with transglutaminase-like and TPR domain
MRNRNHRTLLPALLLLAAAPGVIADEVKTVIGPSNLFLADGAQALLANRGEEGVELTLQGLKTASGSAEFKMAHSNLCAGYLLIDKPLDALRHCNEVLAKDPNHWRTYNNRALVYMRLERYDEADADIRKGQVLRPDSEKLKIVKGMYLDETQPVRETIELDERRDTTDEAAAEADRDATTP